MKLHVFELNNEVHLCGDLVKKYTKLFKSRDLLNMYMASIDLKLSVIGYHKLVNTPNLLCYISTEGNSKSTYVIYEKNIAIIEELIVDKDGYIKVEL